jgi:hypothetical protein
MGEMLLLDLLAPLGRVVGRIRRTPQQDERQALELH